jgi:protease-4
MDFENSPYPDAPTPPQSGPIPTAVPVGFQPPAREKKKGIGWKIFWGIVLFLSVLTNLFLLIAIVTMGAFLSHTAVRPSSPQFDENVLIDGSHSRIIAVINVDDVIDLAMSDRVQKQLKQAAEDSSVKAVIVRIISPGGYVSSSDQINYEIKRFREKTGKPAVAFMQTVAASGGYYTAVACDKIIAEPTVITGSIGVIMSHLVLQELLEQKLGIDPVVIKSGEKKDWPSMFSPTTEEQVQYLQDRLVQPAFERFLEVVCEGRQDVLTEEEVRALADGSIYPAPQALEKRLIDQIGYLRDAVDLAEKLADIKGARVIEYRERFAFWQYLSAEGKTSFKLDRSTIMDLTTPQLMYLWDGRQ